MVLELGHIGSRSQYVWISQVFEALNRAQGRYSNGASSVLVDTVVVIKYERWDVDGDDDEAVALTTSKISLANLIDCVSSFEAHRTMLS